MATPSRDTLFDILASNSRYPATAPPPRRQTGRDGFAGMQLKQVDIPRWFTVELSLVDIDRCCKMVAIAKANSTFARCSRLIGAEACLSDCATSWFKEARTQTLTTLTQHPSNVRFDHYSKQTILHRHFYLSFFFFTGFETKKLIVLIVQQATKEATTRSINIVVYRNFCINQYQNCIWDFEFFLLRSFW